MKTMTKRAAGLLALAAGLALPAPGNGAQAIPPDRTFGSAWQHAGYPGSIPSPARIVRVTDFGAAGDGATDDAPAVVRAIAALGGRPGVVFFPAGTYRLDAAVSLPAGVVLRGQRANVVTLRFSERVGWHCLQAVREQSAAFQPVVSGHTIHSARLAVTNPAVFATGAYAEVRETNDPAWKLDDWDRRMVGQIVRIAGVEGRTLTLERPLRITYDAALKPEIRPIVPITEVGIENLRIERALTGTEASRNNAFTIEFRYAARCWVRGVESADAFGAHIGADYSTQIEVTGCYLHHAHDYDGGGSGYGVKLEFRTGECRVENNVFRCLRHAMLLQAAANGNVFGYNVSVEPRRTEPPADLAGDVALHQNYPYANLFEGNICQHITIDNSHRNLNGPLNTFFRNRAELHGFNMTDSRCRDQNVVGNETFEGGLVDVAGAGDGYRLQGPGHFEYGNRTQADGLQPPGTGDLADSSYYLNADPTRAPPAPAWWTLEESLPTIGPPRPLEPPKNIPARSRLLAGTVLTVGPPSIGRQPTNQTVNAGATASFAVEAFGTPAARYAWRRNGEALAGATNAALAVVRVTPAVTGVYDVVVNDAGGSVASAGAALTLTAGRARP